MAADSNRKWSSAVGAATPAGTVPTPRANNRGAGFDQKFGESERNDAWWFKPLLQALGLLVLIGYANYAAILGPAHYHFIQQGRDYLSPFYSPYVHPKWLPAWLSPALLILVFPLGFRATCYYYRKAYYRSFFMDPMACAVGEMKSGGYRGETKFPFILQNMHRYFLYAALVFIVILWIDVFKAFWFENPDGTHSVGLAGGSLAILFSTLFISFYTFSCHSLRHFIGGRMDCFSCVAAGGPRHKTWSIVSKLNEHHMGFAWWSLFFVCFADFYVRMCDMGVIRDPRWF